MYESVFYQTIEYVIAPIGLMIFLFYVKNVDLRERTFNPKFKENGIESLFIAAYSHVLYYFSITAHADGFHTDKIIEISKSACLMSAVLGLMLLFILKYYTNMWGIKHWKSKMSTNSTAFWLMLFLFSVICFSNFKGWNFNFQQLKNPWFFFQQNLIFILYPNNILFVLAAIVILGMQFKLNSKPHELTKNVNNFLNLDTNRKETNDEDTLINYSSIGNSNANPIFVRVDAFVTNAKILKEKGDQNSLMLALSEIEKAKRIALEGNYPESLLYGIKKIKIHIHCLLNDESGANNEILEIEKQNQDEKNIELIEMRNEWIATLRSLIISLKQA